MSEDRFLSRWSRMKARSRGGRPAAAERPRAAPNDSAWRPHEAAALVDAPPAAEAAAEVEAQTQLESESGPQDSAAPARADPGSVEGADDAAVLADWPEDLPHPDSLDSESDYSQFFSPEVSEAVRNIALRRLWRSNPVFANVDGLVDYGEDFTDAATVIAGMKSAYQVGKGYARDVEEKLAQTEEALADAEADEPPGEPASEAGEAEAMAEDDQDDGRGEREDVARG